jgi:hypothetical protein
MHGRKDQLQKKLHDLIQQTSQVAAELEALERQPGEVPAYRQIEQVAHQAGRQLSCAIQQTQLTELANQHLQPVPCPECQTVCGVQSKKRTAQSLDGPVELLEPQAHCPLCRRDFFPSA